MGLYRVMLVDDEEDVRQAIARKINWEEIGFQVVASAENGQEALELAERLHPDVVMTDIKMPFMDGLTLGREIDQKRNESRLNAYYQESLPIMREQFLIGLLEGRIPDEEIDKTMASYEMEFKAGHYAVAVGTVERTEDAAGRTGESAGAGRFYQGHHGTGHPVRAGQLSGKRPVGGGYLLGAECQPDLFFHPV